MGLEADKADEQGVAGEAGAGDGVGRARLAGGVEELLRGCGGQPARVVEAAVNPGGGEEPGQDQAARGGRLFGLALGRGAEQNGRHQAGGGADGAEVGHGALPRGRGCSAGGMLLAFALGIDYH